jgi:hypothetical protein
MAESPEISIDLFTSIILKCWSRETSRLQHLWVEGQPSIGQSLPTAFLVQDVLGGEVIGGHCQHFLHYWNVLPTGVEIDFCREHFGPTYTLYRSPHFVHRLDIDLENGFFESYNLLRTAFMAHLNFKTCTEVRA